jgi:hypothetical protein
LNNKHSYLRPEVSVIWKNLLIEKENISESFAETKPEAI